MEKIIKTSSIAIVASLIAGLCCSEIAIAQDKAPSSQKNTPKVSQEQKTTQVKVGELEFSLPDGYVKKGSSGNETTYKSKNSVGQITITKTKKTDDYNEKLMKNPTIRKHVKETFSGLFQCIFNQYDVADTRIADILCLSEDGEKSFNIYKINSSKSSYIIIVNPSGADAKMIRRTIKVNNK